MHMVRRATADVVAAVAKLTVPGGAWPQLLGQLHAWAQQTGSGDHRELALLVFSSLAEVIGEHMAPALPTLMGIVGAGALRAVERLLGLVEQEEHVLAFHALVADLLQVCSLRAGV